MLTRRVLSLLVCGCVAAALCASPALAVPVVDGRFDPGEGYTLGRYLNLTVEGLGPIAQQGELWTYQDPSSGDVFFAITQPKELIDNTYGANTVGWPRAHNFSDLTGSDKAQVQLTNALGQTVLDFNFDYFTAVGSGYDSLGATGGDGKILVGQLSWVVEWATSLDYNFNVAGYKLTTDSPATDAEYTPNITYPDWVYEVTYEGRISAAAFGTAGYGDIAVPVLHDSPNKLGKNKTWTETDGTIPEPTSMALLAAGGWLLALRRRKRNVVA